MSEFFKKEETPEVIEEQAVPVEEEKKPEPKADRKPKPQKKSKTDDFITRKLKVINTMSNPAKARSIAERVLNNRKVVK